MKPQKFVTVSIYNQFLMSKTEKAQLVKVYRKGQPASFWLPLSVVSFSANPYNADCTLCLMPAWLYYRDGFNDRFPYVRWTTQVEQTDSVIETLEA